MTLRELIAEYPVMFYPQTWYAGEDFLDITPRALDFPTTVHATGAIEPQVTAADLAGLWLRDHTRGLWARYLWTCDHDRHGQRVYVGVNDGRFELHRHIHLTERFGVPIWSIA